MTSIENPMGSFIIFYISFCSKLSLFSIKSADTGFVCTVNGAYVYYVLCIHAKSSILCIFEIDTLDKGPIIYNRPMYM
jgi:hypothetical protein